MWLIDLLDDENSSRYWVMSESKNFKVIPDDDDDDDDVPEKPPEKPARSVDTGARIEVVIACRTEAKNANLDLAVGECGVVTKISAKSGSWLVRFDSDSAKRYWVTHKNQDKYKILPKGAASAVSLAAIFGEQLLHGSGEMVTTSKALAGKVVGILYSKNC